MSVDEKIAVLYEFHEWRQEAGLAGAHWESAAGAWEVQLHAEERADVVKEMRVVLAGEGDAQGLSAAEREGLLLSLLDQIK